MNADVPKQLFGRGFHERLRRKTRPRSGRSDGYHKPGGKAQVSSNKIAVVAVHSRLAFVAHSTSPGRGGVNLGSFAGVPSVLSFVALAKEG